MMELGQPQQLEPSQITVTVFSARNIQSRKKGDICHASVVFGVGKDYFVTETVESNSPEWNQEALINVAGRLHGVVKFKVRDRDHTLGVVSIPISEVPSRPGERWHGLQPHRKSHEAHGELLVKCWVSEQRPISSEKGSPITSSRTSSTEDLSHAGVGHKVKDMFSFHRRTPSWTRGSRHERHSSHEADQRPHPFSGSDNELHSRRGHLGRSYQSDTNLHNEAASPEHAPQSRSGDSIKLTPSEPEAGEPTCLPEVSGISPNEGAVEGGERVTLRGSHLGASPGDIKRVIIADVDCTETLEYFSPSKLIVTTFPRATPGSGPVVIETEGGGVGTSSNNYTFVARNSVRGNGGVDTSGSSLFRRKSRPTEVELLEAEMKALKQSVRDLKDANVALKEENVSLHSYIDNLLLSVINTTPEILEVPRPSQRSQGGFVQ